MSPFPGRGDGLVGTGTVQSGDEGGTNARDVIRSESAEEPVENYPAGARSVEPCISVQQLAERLKSILANVPWVTLNRLVSGTPKRVSKCAALCEEHISM